MPKHDQDIEFSFYVYREVIGHAKQISSFSHHKKFQCATWDLLSSYVYPSATCISDDWSIDLLVHHLLCYPIKFSVGNNLH